MDHLSTRRARGRRAAVALVATIGLVLASPVAVAKKDDAKKLKEDCRESSSVKLKVEPESGGVLQVTAVVWSDDSDEWDWRMKHNDDVSARGSVKAKDADKSFKIVRDMADFTGPDEIVFRAGNKDSDEICRGDVTFNG